MLGSARGTRSIARPAPASWHATCPRLKCMERASRVPRFLSTAARGIFQRRGHAPPRASPGRPPRMITGIHTLIYAKEAEKVRAFFRDTLGFRSVDAGNGWLIFELPPAELGIHPDPTGGAQELYLMCDDLDATIAALERNGVAFAGAISEASFGRLTPILLPGGGRLRRSQAARP